MLETTSHPSRMCLALSWGNGLCLVVLAGRNSDQGTAIRSISRMVRLKKVLKIAKILDQTSAGKNEAI